MGGAQPAYGKNAANQLRFILPAYRLYNSIDELAFDPERVPLSSPNSTLYPATIGSNPTGISPNGRQSLGLTPKIIQQRRFFVTAHSRAPEETLFGTPRVSIDPNQTTPALPDFATAFAKNATNTIDNYVRYRVVSIEAFTP